MDGAVPSRSPIDTAWEVDSPSKLAVFLADLAERARNGKTPVENPSSVEMIEASGAWVEGIERFLSARGYDAANLSPWAAVAMVYSAGLIYE
ncbi:MAG TPA: hypothetical protein VGS19_33240 [Streptosporangiaceae bacterium]|nr:hypothetical protein [Streptosporangiaceae bacterium]